VLQCGAVCCGERVTKRTMTKELTFESCSVLQ